MIGSGLKKLAADNGLTVSKGVAYGNLKGYATTLSEGAGFKRIDISTRFTETSDMEALQQELNKINIQKEYRVQQLQLNIRSINIIFLDNPGTMKKITDFIEWFYPLLSQHNATPVTCCTECGQEITDSKWILIDGIAYHMHTACAQKVRWEITADEGEAKMNATGSYLSGFIGAFLGAAVGGIVWAVVLLVGYVASIVGLLIGYLAQFGYNLLKGKQSKGKVVILILAVIFGVLFGNFAADAISLGQMISAGELPGFTYGDIPLTIIGLLLSDSEYLMSTLGNIAMGLIFAALGVFAMLKKASKEVSGVKVVDL